ncbi:MAG: glycosyltransferase family 2 protein [Rhodospirillaceae bacterium]|nr:glycosyltransferase family 2 protein [Rhodospirillaceae bacterium]
MKAAEERVARRGACGLRRSHLYASGRPVISAVIPALNEAKNLPHVLPRIPLWVDEIVLVDGHSTDGTATIARELIPEILIVEKESNGKGAALRAGFAAARGDIIVALDADGSTDPAEIPAFVGALLGGADFVKGSRFAQGGGTDDMEWYRRLGNWALTQLVRLRFGGRFTDLCYGYNAFWRDVLPQLDIGAADGFEIEANMNIEALRAGLRVCEVASVELRRVNGESRLRTIPDGWRVLKTILRLALRTRRRRLAVEAGVGAPEPFLDPVAPPLQPPFLVRK